MFTYLRGLVADAGRSRALGVFGPLSLQVGPDDGVQRKGPADGGLGRPRRCPVHCWWETEEAHANSMSTPRLLRVCQNVSCKPA